jgi:predicted aconitase with swiveling domain
MLRLRKNNVAPKAIINRECETIVAVGAIISDIPCVDKIDVEKIKTGDKLVIDADKGEVFIQ